MKILVIDDSPSQLQVVRAQIEVMGSHEVLTAENSSDGYKLFMSEHPDLLLIDVNMPGVDGYETTRRIRKHSGDDWVPIIFMSSMFEDDHISRGIEAGGDDYLKKPVSDIVLQAKIKAMSRIADMHNKLIEVTRELEKLSNVDGLTGINNRRYFDVTLKKEWARAKRHKRELGLLLIDIDYFKPFNDNYGYQAGDGCLKTVARALSKCFKRASDTLARYGGEEFVVILPDTDHAGAKAVAANIQKAIAAMEQQHAYSEVSDLVTVSIGIAVCVPDVSTNPKALIQEADEQLYEAKQGGRNTWRMAS